MDVKIFRINYKSDFILTLNSDAGWMTPFCIKFWTGAPSQAFFVGWDGTTYTHCSYDPSEPTKLVVQFDDHHLPIGDLKFQIAYHFTVADFPDDTEDEVINPASITVEIDGEQYQVMLDFTGETAPEIAFSLPAYANEAQRIANEEQRIANEEQRIANEEARIAAETIRQQNEAQRISNEESRVTEFARLKQESETATADANAAAALANEKAALADDKAALADAAATLANEKAQLAADKAALAQAAATLANEKAALAQQKAAYAQTQGDYAKAQGDYAKEQGEIAEEDHERAEADHTRAESDHTQATSDHTQAGTDHSTAVNDHTQSVTDHTQADTDHTRAESDHTQAASDHTQAGADHTRAESDHTTASADHTQAGQDHTRAESDHTRAESDHAAVEVYVDSLGAFDISAYHATGSVLAKYADLTDAIGIDGANIPETLRKGGMSVKFVQSSDNNYVLYMYKVTDATTAATFTNVANWEKVNLEEEIGQLEGKVNESPSIGNVDNGNADDFYIVDSDGNAVLELTKGQLRTKNFDTEGSVPTISNDSSSSDLNVVDSNGHVILELKGGHIKTKSFDSRNEENVFSDLDIICMGDSITWYGGDDCTGERGWTKWFKDKANPKSIRSFARSGATLTSDTNSTEDIEDYSSVRSSKNIAYNQLARIRAAYAGTPSSYDAPITTAPDIVFLAFGTNDLTNETAYSETPASEFDGKTAYATYSVNQLLTFAKAMRYICEQLYVLFPDTQIIYIAPQQPAVNESSGRKNGTGYLALGDILEKCCDYLSINCIRMDKHCGTYDIREIVENHKYPSGDNYHPNALGAKENGYYIFNQTKSFLKY